MVKNKTEKFGKPLYVLYPGDFCAVKEDCLMQTVTGDSLVVCLYDNDRKIGGMAHFIVPGEIEDEIYADKVAKEGINSMELLMAEIVKLGGDRKNLRAKLFGAGSNSSSMTGVKSLKDSNIRFVHEYFTLENIKIEKEDLGGEHRRMIYFSPVEGSVFRRFQRRAGDSSEFTEMENEYISQAIKNKDKSGEVILF